MTTQQSGPSRARAAAPRTLAEELRARSDEALTGLLRARPDLLNPVPGDLTQLSARLSSRASALRALERLDRFTLQVAEALAAAPDGSSDTVVRNLLAGHGPVYNIGERVEAFTNPLWVALLTGSGALGLPLEACAVYIGLTCSIVALVVAQHWSRRLHAAQRGEPRTFALPLRTLVMATLPPLWDFGTSGLETELMFV